MYRLTCPHCQNVMMLDPNQLGTIIQCNQCQRRLKPSGAKLPSLTQKPVPAPSARRRPPRDEVSKKPEFCGEDEPADDVDREETGNKRKKKKPAGRFGHPWALAAMVAGMAVVGIGIFFSIRGGSPPPEPQEAKAPEPKPEPPLLPQPRPPQPKPDPVLPPQPEPKNDHAGNKDPIPVAVKEPPPPSQNNLSASTWFGMVGDLEIKGSVATIYYRPLEFQFGVGGSVTMVINNNNEARTSGKYTHAANSVIITFPGSVTYRGTIDGETMSGTASNSKVNWIWKVNRQ